MAQDQNLDINIRSTSDLKALEKTKSEVKTLYNDLAKSANVVDTRTNSVFKEFRVILDKAGLRVRKLGKDLQFYDSKTGKAIEQNQALGRVLNKQYTSITNLAKAYKYSTTSVNSYSGSLRSATGATKHFTQQANAASKQTSWWGMNFLSFMFIGMQVQRMFQRLIMTTTSAYKKVTAQNNEATESFAKFGIGVKMMQVAVGEAVATALKPLGDNIIQIATNVSNFVSSNQKLIGTMVLVGPILGFAAFMGSQFALTLMSISNLAIQAGVSMLSMAGAFGVVFVGLAAITAIWLTDWPKANKTIATVGTSLLTVVGALALIGKYEPLMWLLAGVGTVGQWTITLAKGMWSFVSALSIATVSSATLLAAFFVAVAVVGFIYYLISKVADKMGGWGNLINSVVAKWKVYFWDFYIWMIDSVINPIIKHFSDSLNVLLKAIGKDPIDLTLSTKGAEKNKQEAFDEWQAATQEAKDKYGTRDALELLTADKKEGVGNEEETKDGTMSAITDSGLLGSNESMNKNMDVLTKNNEEQKKNQEKGNKEFSGVSSLLKKNNKKEEEKEKKQKDMITQLSQINNTSFENMNVNKEGKKQNQESNNKLSQLKGVSLKNLGVNKENKKNKETSKLSGVGKINTDSLEGVESVTDLSGKIENVKEQHFNINVSEARDGEDSARQIRKEMEKYSKEIDKYKNKGADSA